MNIENIEANAICQTVDATHLRFPKEIFRVRYMYVYCVVQNDLIVLMHSVHNKLCPIFVGVQEHIQFTEKNRLFGQNQRVSIQSLLQTYYHMCGYISDVYLTTKNDF